MENFPIEHRHQRRSSVALVDGRQWCRLTFEEAPGISQGFRVVGAACSQCVLRRQKGDLCSHLAVLASHLLVESTGRTMPTPLSYGGSQWAMIARFLYQHGSGVAASVGTDGRLSFSNDYFRMSVRLDPTDLALAKILFPGHGLVALPQESSLALPEIQDLWEHLQAMARTDNEAAFNLRGQQSQGQRLASSLWTFCCQAVFRALPEPQWRLGRHEDGIFFLSAISAAGDCLFSLTPSRDLLFDLLQQARLSDLITITDDKARAYSKLYFCDDSGELVIEPWLELAGGERYDRLAIDNCRFGRYYSLSGHSFFTVDEHGDNFDDDADSVPALFALATPVRYTARRIAVKDIPAFIRKHHSAMLAGGHDLDPQLVDFSVADLPDCLEIVDYHEDGDWCLLSGRYGFGANRVEIAEVMRLRQAGMRHIAGRTTWLQVEGTPLGWMHSLPSERVVMDKGQDFVRLTRREMMAVTALVPEIVYPSQEEARNRSVAQPMASPGPLLKIPCRT